jgi:hypothetical protein
MAENGTAVFWADGRTEAGCAAPVCIERKKRALPLFIFKKALSA